MSVVFFFNVLDYFNDITVKNIFLKSKIFYFNIFLNKKYF